MSGSSGALLLVGGGDDDDDGEACTGSDHDDEEEGIADDDVEAAAAGAQCWCSYAARLAGFESTSNAVAIDLNMDSAFAFVQCVALSGCHLSA